jgi:DNA-directed RNA polymerase I, II, and III subunit RPABC1
MNATQDGAVDKETIRTWRVHKTVLQMVHDRGYLVTQQQLDQSLSEFITTFVPGGSCKPDRGLLRQTFVRASDPSDGIIVAFFEDAGTVGVKPVRELYEQMTLAGRGGAAVSRAIVVTRAGLTPSAAKAIATLQNVVMEHFTENELVVNITEHVLVPKHVLLSDEEKRVLLQRYRLKETQLPRILVSDPVARYYGLRRGQVVKILRASETAGRYITYRLAV